MRKLFATFLIGFIQILRLHFLEPSPKLHAEFEGKFESGLVPFHDERILGPRLSHL
jgi:hypothetical protein